ncbi:spore maturation protein CgeB [Pontibacter ummariensis]|uniref:Spore maturation protein CgeB n=1 Tax=Pontibacter ummariensis TaxID=1610492 RepID=A0A239KHL5_9BACT|nr:glycosyltransferase [Pontibacter ummariensis]PRY05726.1 spore maturation protein CgeB [Pontibacter ummariensis]SNT17886.1 Spore maturation protein CgeB [Pontibacter ummariensis]
MNITLFYHSILSDWNHGNAHFLRGIVRELEERGHQVSVYEPKDGWSLQNLVEGYGKEKLDELSAYYPNVNTNFYTLDTLDLDTVLQDADLVLVHEWNEHELVKRVGEHRAKGGDYKLIFHDTHHRAVTARDSMAQYDLTHYDGVLAFGQKIRDLYLQEGWTEKAWTWHEAADTSVFYPHDREEHEGDLIWIGNWGDEERTAELHEFLINPVKELGLKAKIYGVRYPDHARKALADAGIEYGGWLPNYKAPEEFAKYKVTVHVPRRPYVEALPGIPTIRPFEALACGIPLISSPWDDAENLFTPGKDFLVAQNGEEMKEHLQIVLQSPEKAKSLAAHGLQTIRNRHTCAHRVDELEKVCEELGIATQKIYLTQKEQVLHEQ